MIVFGGDVHLALAREPAPRARVLDAIEIALEAQPERIGLLGARSHAGADRTGRARRQREVERVLALLAANHAPPDERGMRRDGQLPGFCRLIHPNLARSEGTGRLRQQLPGPLPCFRRLMSRSGRGVPTFAIDSLESAPVLGRRNGLA